MTSACRTVAAVHAVSASSTTARALGRRVELGLLRQIADRQPSTHAERSAVGLLDAREDLRQRRLSGSVRADEPDLLAARQRERRVIEDDLRPERLAEMLSREGGHARLPPLRAASFRQGQGLPGAPRFDRRIDPRASRQRERSRNHESEVTHGTRDCGTGLHGTDDRRTLLGLLEGRRPVPRDSGAASGGAARSRRTSSG